VLVEHVRKHGGETVKDRIKERDRDREKRHKSEVQLLRFAGEVVGPEEADDGVREEEVVVSDPRKEKTIRVPPSLRPGKMELGILAYEVGIWSSEPHSQTLS